MLTRIVLSLIVAVATALGFMLIGTLLAAAGGPLSVVGSLGVFFYTYAALIGLLAGVWYFFTGRLA